MEIIVVAILVVLVIGWISGGIWLTIHNKALEKVTSTCSKCGDRTKVKPDFQNCRLVVSCQNNKCLYVSSRPVRPSALSLFGITQLLLIFLVGILSYMIVDVMKFHLLFKVIVVLLCTLIGSIAIRFFIRAIVFSLIQVNLPVALQEEMVAYLSTPEFLKRENNR